MKTKIVYPAIFTYDEKEDCYLVDFIDFNCSTFGKTLKEVFFMAEDAMGLYFEDEKVFPKSTEDYKNIKLNKNQFISLVGVDMLEYYKRNSSKSIKKTLTIPEWLNYIAEENNINFSQVLQEALKTRLNIK